MFVDRAKVYVKAGDGGNGAVSFHREKYVSRGGPDGGDGGKGGDVIFLVDTNLRTLLDFKYKQKYFAVNGKPGAKNNCSGKSGASLFIRVPAGTILVNDKTDGVIADLVQDGDRFTVAYGGKGGAGNQHFATPTRQTPNFAKPGEKGTEIFLRLELKLLADVGLIGFPNVGKSTFLSVASQAKPKIENYHFTTLSPNLGVVSVDTHQSYVMADIPGLIEGAHEGVGLGHDFLRHIERTKLLVHVVDISGHEGRDPLRDFEIINDELTQFNEILSNRPQIVVANKVDILNEEQSKHIFKEVLESKGYSVYFISAATQEGVPELLKKLAELISKLESVSLFDGVPNEPVRTMHKDDTYSVRMEEDIFLIDGPWTERFLSTINLEDYESLQYFQRVMKQKGIIEQLLRLGVQEGDTVKFADFEFEFVE